MPVHLNIAIRLIFCGAAAYAVQIKFPELNYAGLFNVFQMCLLLSLCIVPLAWDRILLLPEIEIKEDQTRGSAQTQLINRFGGHWPLLMKAANALDLADAAEGTPIEKLSILRFLKKFLKKRARKLQEGLFKSLVPAIALSGGLLVAAVVFEKAGLAKADNNTALLVNLLQAYVSAFSFCWTIGLLYGEIELTRDVAQAI